MNKLLFHLLLSLFLSSSVFAYDVNNEFNPNGFPAKTSERSFSIALDPAGLLVIYPDAAEAQAAAMRGLLKAKCGSDISFRKAGGVSRGDLAGRDLIIIGGIADNPWALELYKRRYAFADAYFPGKGGVLVTPSESIWDPARNVIVIGVSSTADAKAGFETFLGLFADGAKKVGPVRILKTTLVSLKPPESVSSVLDFSKSSLSPSGTTSWAVQSASIDKKKDVGAVMAPYATIAGWGISYHLTGDRTWANHFLEGMRFCYERAQMSGKWIPEPWTNVYFCLWKMVYAWDLIDDDPVFTPGDRKMIDEVLWGYTRFCDWLPNLDPDLAPLDEPRQNHTTFLALSLANAYRYFTGKYGIKGLDRLHDKAVAAFDRGGASSSRPNDDAGGYLNLAPGHLLGYQMAENDMSFLESGKMNGLAELIAACIDNRGDQVGFGDVGGYGHLGKGSARPSDSIFLSMAAWYSKDPVWQWLYKWSVSSDKKKREGDFRFNLNEIYNGSYAVDGPEAFPARYDGVHPVMLDNGILRWSALRSWKNSWAPRAGTRYFDKLTFRKGFDPEGEYLLIDGTSTLSHGHYDGNSVLRLTWKDRVWLFETDYVKLTARYHNGVTVTRDGVQEEPAPLTELDYHAEFPGTGVTGTTSRDYNGADWTRTTVWKKGRYFLFLDTVKALREGGYRLDQRWRTRGDVSAVPGALTVVQGDTRMTIATADDAPRSVEEEPDAFLSTGAAYPYGKACTTIWHARKDISLARNGTYTFASLVSVGADSTRTSKTLLAGGSVYVIRDGSSTEIVGTVPSALAGWGAVSDCALFTTGEGGIALLNLSRFRCGGVSLESSVPIHLSLDPAGRTGILSVPEGVGSDIRYAGMNAQGITVRRSGSDAFAHVKPGTYRIALTAALPDIRTFVRRMAETAVTVAPESPRKPFLEFGMKREAAFAPADSICAFCPDGGGVVYGDVKGIVSRFERGAAKKLFSLESGKPVTAVHAADIDGDGAVEIIAGDSGENLSCYDVSGARRWTMKLSKYYGPNANPVHISSADIDGSGKKVVLAATAGWKLYAVNPDGAVRWESFTFYHPQTKAEFFKDDSGASYIAVGTAYQTPLNIVSPKDGSVLWHVWEEMGSEFIAKTKYCGIILTDMTFLDTDRDGVKEVVFGTKYNTVYALDAKTGATKWEANVGDEVTAVRLITGRPDGESLIAVATESGDVVLLDRSGRKMLFTSVASGIADIGMLPLAGMKRTDIVAGMRDGGVAVLDDRSLLVRAALAPTGSPIKGVVYGGKEGAEEVFFTVGATRIDTVRYRPFDLLKMRTD